jgi:hypothetical protein
MIYNHVFRNCCCVACVHGLKQVYLFLRTTFPYPEKPALTAGYMVNNYCRYLPDKIIVSGFEIVTGLKQKE